MQRFSGARAGSWKQRPGVDLGRTHAILVVVRLIRTPKTNLRGVRASTGRPALYSPLNFAARLGLEVALTSVPTRRASTATRYRFQGNKLSALIDLLKRPEGATVEDKMTATGVGS